MIRRAHPFLAARLGYSRLSGTVGDESLSLNGLLGGLGLGLEYWLTHAVGFTAGVLFHVLSYESHERIPVKPRGGQVSLRSGLKLRLGT